jgi:hypothetical protein
MTVFQYLALGVVLLLAYSTLRAGMHGRVRRRIVVFWMLVWTVTGVASAWPRGTMLAARAVGIGRGTDLVLYCSVLATLVGFFYIYTRFRRVERDLTLLTRELAMRDPRLPPPRPLAPESHDPSAVTETSSASATSERL